MPPALEHFCKDWEAVIGLGNDGPADEVEIGPHFRHPSESWDLRRWRTT